MTALSDMLGRLKKGEEPKQGEITDIMTSLMNGELSDDAIVNLLTGLRERGETAAVIAEAARVMRNRCVRVPTAMPGLLDTCGTGGDGSKTLNVSTLTALVAAAAGVPIAKHGNRSVTGVTGSADLLEALGVRIQLAPEEVAASIEATGFGFIYAPLFHPAMKFAAAARKRIQGRTLFNCLGPLTNPAGASRQLLGVYDSRLLEPLCKALGELGSVHVIVVHGEPGLDEVSLSGRTDVAEWMDGSTAYYSVKPEDFGLTRVPLGELKCETREDAVRTAEAVLNGGPACDFVLLNSGFALKAADRCPTVDQGIALARKLLTGGMVMKKLEDIRNFTQHP